MNQQQYSPRESEAERKERLKREWEDHVKAVKARAYGNWDEIMARYAGDILGAAMAKPGKHVPCPFHTPTRDGFKVFKNFPQTGGAMCNTCGTWADGWALLNRIDGRSFAETIKDVGRNLGLPWKYDKNDSPVKPIEMLAELKKVPDAAEVARKDEWLAKMMKETWAGTYDVMHEASEPLRNYLRKRGITSAVGPLEDVRFHPSLGYFENNTEIATYGAFMALLRQPDGKPMCLQRGYITPEGDKAPVERGQERKMTGHRSTAVYKGSAVRLDQSDRVGSVLCVSEGVETALAFRAMSGLPTWATCVAGLMETVVVPDSVQVLVVAADKDRSGRGLEAASVLQKRMRDSGRKATIYMPPFDLDAEAKSVDWNDVLLRFTLAEARKQVFMTGLRDQIAGLLESMGFGWETAMSHY